MTKPPTIRIKFIEPGHKFPRRRLSREEIGLRHDMSQFYPMKATIERLFGHPTYMRLKETASISDWRHATCRLLDAIEFSIKSTVEVADKDWFAEVADLIQRGKSSIKTSERMADLFSSLAATLAEISFTQIGSMPDRSTAPKTIPLDARYWTFRRYRTVVYVQNSTQQEETHRKRARLDENRRRMDAEHEPS